MASFIVTLIIGIVCILLGISNMRGNISSLHSYHRHRVTEEDKPAFGKKVGTGIVLTGCAIVVHSLLSILTLLTNLKIFTVVGSVILTAGLFIGLFISLYAIKKYNKGIF